MNRRAGGADAIVAGGGVVGAACALALARAGLDVVLVEGGHPPRWSRESPDVRVFAFAADNALLFDELGVWPAIVASRLQPYRRMRVWEAGGGGELVFDADAYGRRELGWIVENALLQDRLWAALVQAGVRIESPAKVEGLEQDADGVRLRLDDGRWLSARLAIAADGGRSTLRALAGIEAPAHDYGQRGVVGYVATTLAHDDTAWQRFLPGGPLALLPFADGNCSIVWSLPDAEATRVLGLDDEAFGRELTRASDGRLGGLRPLSPRAAFPLRRQLADRCLAGRVLVLGDAAHVVHPLAGQGVNLGLRDVAALRAQVVDAMETGGDWAAPSRLVRWARGRRSEAAVAAYAFEAIHRAFTADHVAAALLRGPLLGMAGRIPPLTHALWRRAAGL